MGGVKDDLIHELVDQAVLNKESIEWIVEEVQSWERYTQELKIWLIWANKLIWLWGLIHFWRTD